MLFRSLGHNPRQIWSHQLNSALLASACNSDCRFEEAGWAETPESVEGLFADGAFQTALTKLNTSSIEPGLAAIVASVYACRVGERGTPRKVGMTARKAVPPVTVPV